MPRPKCGECIVADWCASYARYTAPRSLVADERGTYEARPVRTKKPQPKFEESARYYRGRIVDALRALALGESIAIDDLRRDITNGSRPIDPAAFEGYVDALERAGLLSRDARDGVSLPD